MNYNDTVLESFINFCDEMQIVEEGFIETILGNIQKAFAKLVLLLERNIKKCKDTKLKSILLDLLKRAKKALSKCSSLSSVDPELSRKIAKELNDEKEEILQKMSDTGIEIIDIERVEPEKNNN